jgi:hypothetical protein
LSERAIRAAIADGRLPVIRPAGVRVVLIGEVDLEAFIAERAVRA